MTTQDARRGVSVNSQIALRDLTGRRRTLRRMSPRIAFLPLALVVAIAGCGGSSSSNTGTNAASSTTGTNAGRAGGIFQNAQVRACLQKQGVTLPNRRQGGGRPPQGGNGTPPNGGGGQGFGGGQSSARFAKLRKAMQACGVTPPAGGPGQGAPPAQGTGSTGTS
ncbi:MAG: hypothetical protein QOF12_1094 [Solirubrobacteraceae bacterium]|nr:hypothetical protein [Solirubrobacteraceae bacterium]